MKLITLKYFEKKTKASLIRYIVKRLRKKSKKQLANFAYNITKSKLPRLKTTTTKRMIARKRQKDLGMARRRLYLGEKIPADYTWLHKTGGKRKTKRKARFKKGSPEAKRYMAKLRRMRK